MNLWRSTTLSTPTSTLHFEQECVITKLERLRRREHGRFKNRQLWQELPAIPHIAGWEARHSMLPEARQSVTAHPVRPYFLRFATQDVLLPILRAPSPRAKRRWLLEPARKHTVRVAGATIAICQSIRLTTVPSGSLRNM